MTSTTALTDSHVQTTGDRYTQSYYTILSIHDWVGLYESLGVDGGTRHLGVMPAYETPHSLSNGNKRRGYFAAPQQSRSGLNNMARDQYGRHDTTDARRPEILPRRARPSPSFTIVPHRDYRGHGRPASLKVHNAAPFVNVSRERCLRVACRHGADERWRGMADGQRADLGERVDADIERGECGGHNEERWRG